MGSENLESLSKEERAAELVDQKPPPLQLDEHGLYILKTQADEFRFADMLLRTGAVDRQKFPTPAHVMAAVQALKSLKLNPHTALRQCGFLRNSFTVYGDLELAVVRMSGKLEYLHEFHYVRMEDGQHVKRSFANSNSHLPIYGACCQIKRVDEPEHEVMYTIDDAKGADLWGKPGPWRTFWPRMLQMRARTTAIKTAFPDLTQGVQVQEYDIEGVDYGDKHQEAK